MDKENKIEKVEQSLYDMAIGYYTVDVDETWAVKLDSNGQKVLDANGDPILELIGIKKKKKFQPKGVMAAKEFLKVEHPEKYAQLNKDKLASKLSDLVGAITDTVEDLFDDVPQDGDAE